MNPRALSAEKEVAAEEAWLDSLVPQTELGRVLIAARREFLRRGGRLLSADEILEMLAGLEEGD